jgi:putative restriction endonuclease
MKRMPALRQDVLYAKLVAALPPQAQITTAVDEVRPLVAEIPGFGRVRIYLWTLTHIGQTQHRQPDEFKIELILPDQPRGTQAALDLSGPAFTVLLGYSPDYGVFAGWEAHHHAQFGYSTHVHIREDVLVDAHASGWAVAPARRLLRGGYEVRVAFTPSNLITYLLAAREADAQNVSAESRELFFIMRTPRVPEIPKQGEHEDIKHYAARIRRRVSITRATRDSLFGRRIRDQFSDACAICGTQLDVVEGAHIIAVNEERSEDELWNGVALCRNHHKLFDARVLIITAGLQVRVDNGIVDYFRSLHRAAGLDVVVTPFADRPISRPRFFEQDQELSAKMIDAFHWREHFAGVH